MTVSIITGGLFDLTSSKPDCYCFYLGRGFRFAPRVHTAKRPIIPSCVLKYTTVQYIFTKDGFPIAIAVEKVNDKYARIQVCVLDSDKLEAQHFFIKYNIEKGSKIFSKSIFTNSDYIWERIYGFINTQTIYIDIRNKISKYGATKISSKQLSRYFEKYCLKYNNSKINCNMSFDDIMQRLVGLPQIKEAPTE